MTNFDAIPNRQGTSCEKWDGMKEAFGTDGLLPLWVADMDFQTPDFILAALQDKLSQGVLGYEIYRDELLRAVASWQEKEHNFLVKEGDILFSHGVVNGIALALEAVTGKGEGVIYQPPVYAPFFNTINEMGRVATPNPLVFQDGRWQMNFDELESLASTTCRVLLLCSPHNPVGRVWTREELAKLAEIAVRKNLIVISDEIHQDFCYSGHCHIPIATLDGMASRTITITAPSKTFNVAGLKGSCVIIQDETLKEKYKSVQSAFHLKDIGIFERCEMEAAYSQGSDWKNELVAYLEGNRDLAYDFIKRHLPRATVAMPEGTYLMWIDFTGYGFQTSGELQDFLVKKARLALTPATLCCEARAFARLNLGTSRAMLEIGLERLRQAMEEYTNEEK